MRSGAFLLIFLANHVWAQWSLGPATFLHSNDRVKQLRGGLLARAECKLDDRWTVTTSLGSSLPTSTKVDYTIGGPRQLAAGPAIATRRSGNEYDLDQFFGCGIRGRIGQVRKRGSRPFFYGGLDLFTVRDAFVWKVEVTVLSSVEQYQTRGSNSYWSIAMAPVIGFRTNNDQGRFFAELSPMFCRRIDERGEPWGLRHTLTVGYLWTIGM